MKANIVERLKMLKKYVRNYELQLKLNHWLKVYLNFVLSFPNVKPMKDCLILNIFNAKIDLKQYKLY